MESLAFTFGICSVIVAGMIIWTYTPSGKRWLENL